MKWINEIFEKMESKMGNFKGTKSSFVFCSISRIERKGEKYVFFRRKQWEDSHYDMFS